MDANERRYWAESPKGMEPRGRWEWSYASDHWQFCVDDETLLEFSEAGLIGFKGRIPKEEPFIEVFEDTFLQTIVIRRIYTDDPKVILAFLRERGMPVEGLVMEGGEVVDASES